MAQTKSVIVYVTMNVPERRPLLDRPDVVAAILDAWKFADHWLVGRYVIMPDHLHFFCAPVMLPGTPLKRWMGFWRAMATRHWPRRDETPIWQKDFFDRQLRTGESYHQKWLYVWQNPVVANICATPEHWPWVNSTCCTGTSPPPKPQHLKTWKDELLRVPL